MSTFLADKAHRQRIVLLMWIAVVSVILWQTRIGGLVLYPFTILATWFHEMGHGLAAMLTGASFERLLIYPDGSGLAQSMVPDNASGLTHALIAASGPLGPAIAGSLLIIASRTDKATRVALMVVGLALILTTVIWVRTMTGWVVLPALGIAILGLAWRGTADHRQFGIQLLGVQACISVWEQFSYLFSAGGSIGGELHRSDTSVIADALLFPYWVWGAAISVVIVLLLWSSFALAFRR